MERAKGFECWSSFVLIPLISTENWAFCIFGCALISHQNARKQLETEPNCAKMASAPDLFLPRAASAARRCMSAKTTFDYCTRCLVPQIEGCSISEIRHFRPAGWSDRQPAKPTKTDSEPGGRRLQTAERLSPHFRMRESKVAGFTPSSSAAPSGPLTFQRVFWRASKRLSRSRRCNSALVRISG